MYNCEGNIERVVKRSGSGVDYSATRLVYGANDRTVTFITDETWQASNPAPTTPITNYALTAVREYRNGSGRGRYMARKYNPARVMANMTNPNAWSLFDEELPAEQLEEIFTDYEGDEAYGDFYRNPYNPVVDSFSYEPGMWRKDLVSGTSEYLHNDHLGTLRQTTSSTGALGAHRVYSAFGERNASPTPADRHGYVGAHGYQTHAASPYLHVGARYYDPSSGRFLQRDPIGINGGYNVYAYVLNQPTFKNDPSGKGFWDGVKIVIIGVGDIVGGGLLYYGTFGGGPAGWAIVGGVVLAVALYFTILELYDIINTAYFVVQPIQQPVKQRNSAVDCAIDDAGLGMGDD